MCLLFVFYRAGANAAECGGAVPREGRAGPHATPSVVRDRTIMTNPASRCVGQRWDSQESAAGDHCMSSLTVKRCSDCRPPRTLVGFECENRPTTLMEITITSVTVVGLDPVPCCIILYPSACVCQPPPPPDICSHLSNGQYGLIIVMYFVD